MRQPETLLSNQTSLPKAWQIGFGVVRHTRKQPVTNSFSYRSFFVDGDANTLLSKPDGNWLFGINRPALMSMRVQDHGDGKFDLKWLSDMLEAEGLPIATNIRFRGFPRVFGYAFKPVSFWFCANDAGENFAIIAEVNNTFGERHCYLLSNSNRERIRNGQLLAATKAFHVSPFRQIVGRYHFRFVHRAARSAARIDHYETDRNVLQTSISGTHVPLSNSACLRAIFCYPLFSFGVIARIHWQAIRLWIKQVPFISKPQPPTQFVTPGSNLNEE
jgi:DUF1365 family protein